MSIGPLVSKPPTSLWWSMIAVTSNALILEGNSAGLLVSTTTAGVPSAMSVHDARLGAIPVFENEGCLGIRLAQQARPLPGFSLFRSGTTPR